MSQDMGQFLGLGRAASGVFRSVRKSLFGSTDAAEPPSPQTFAPTPVMPVSSPDADAMRAAKKKSLAEQIARRGRASTILTSDAGETLGS